MIVLTLLLRDLRARLRDRSAILLAIVAPAALIGVLSLTTAGPDTDKIPVGVVDSSTPVGTALAQGPLAALTNDDTLQVRSYDDRAALRRAVDRGDVEGGITVSADGQSVEILSSPDHSVTAAILEAISRSTAITVDGVAQGVGAAQALGTEVNAQQFANRLVDTPATSRVVQATDGSDGIDPKTQVAAGMATFFLFFTVQFGVLGLLEERRQGTLPRILAAPVAPWQVLASKLLVSFVLGLASMAFLAVFSTTLLGAHWGSPLGVVILMLAGVLAAVATVTLVAGVARSQDQANSLQSGLALVLAILGGSFFSVARSGGIAATASRLTPHYWFNEGLVRLTGGRDWTAVLQPVAALLTFAVVVGLPGLLLARKTVRA